MSRSIGPDYQQQVLQIELKELNKIIHNTLKHLTMCDCVDRFKDQLIIYAIMFLFINTSHHYLFMRL